MRLRQHFCANEFTHGALRAPMVCSALWLPRILAIIRSLSEPVNATSVHCDAFMFSHRLTSFTLVLALAACLASCGDAESPEQQIRQVIQQMEKAAEARDVGDLVQHLSSEYRDKNGLDSQAAARYARGYFIANQSIHLLTRIEEIEFPFQDEARARVLIGMVGTDADAAGNWDLAADLVEFNIALRQEDGEWKVSFAEWSRR